MSRARMGLGLAGFALATGLAAGPTRAEPALHFDSLREGHLPQAPAARFAPAEIAAEQGVDGLVLSRQDARFGFHGARRPFWANGEHGWCVSESTTIDAPPSQAGMTISRAKGVTAIRMERLDPSADGEAALEVQDVWVDAATLGARVASRLRLPLSRLATGAGNFAVYGLRDGNTAHVVVPASGAMAFRDASGSTGTTTCSHVRLPLVAEPRSGVMALWMGRINVARAGVAGIMQGDSPRNKAAAGKLGIRRAVQATAARKPRPRQAEDWRVVRVSASLSQTSQEREPVFSIAVGWDDVSQTPPSPPPRSASPDDPLEFELGEE